MYDYLDDKPEILGGKYPSSISIKVTKKKFNTLINKFPFLYTRTINQSFNFTRWDLQKKIFLPINQDISTSKIIDLKNYLKKI